jgi:prepilin-type N-terminal cleavage/methylation domain-containing protein
MARRPRGGFTVLELMVVVAIVGITAALAVPSFTRFQANVRLRDTMRAVANSFQYARAQAIATGSNQVVYVASGAGTDACGNPLQDLAGNPVPLLVLNDGPPAGSNCCIDPGEPIETIPALPGTFWGTSFAAGPAPNDAGAGAWTTGSTFTDQNGNATSWVMFRPDGIPVGFTAACVPGQLGTGAGAVYGTNAQRDLAVVLSPLGGVKVHSWDRVLVPPAWTN